MSTIRCYPVTSGDLEGSTFVQWSGNFSSDADAGMEFSLAYLPILIFDTDALSTRCHPGCQIQES
jgi:hypothetical protein